MTIWKVWDILCNIKWFTYAFGRLFGFPIFLEVTLMMVA